VSLSFHFFIGIVITGFRAHLDNDDSIEVIIPGSGVHACVEEGQVVTFNPLCSSGAIYQVG
jgi:hypothetical protein